jgi:repressor LexA
MFSLETAYTKITRFFESKGRTPNTAELARLCGFSSRNSAYALMKRLVRAKMVRMDTTGKLVLKNVSIEKVLPLIGVVPAGFASPIEDAISETLSLSEYLIRNKEASYILKVQGDSMQDAGIYDGDMVIFERTLDWKLGDIVVALTEDGYTLKYIRRDTSKRLYLEPANSAYPPIYPREGQVVGVVVSVFRKYKA